MSLVGTRRLILGGVAAVSVVAAFLVAPAGDDWVTATPIVTTTPVAHLMPSLFWRPFETLVRLLTGLEPWAFPALNHIVTGSGHVVSAALVCALANRGRADRTGRSAIAGLVFFAAPAVCAAAWSTDTSGQTWSTALGLLATRLAVADRPGNPRWLAAALAAALWKESGLGWLLAAPALRLAEPGRRAGRSDVVPFVFGALGLAAYAVVRYVVLGGGHPIDVQGRYALTADPLLWAVHGSMLLGAAIVPLDTIWFFRGGVSCLAALALAACAAPYVVLVTRSILRRLDARELAAWAFATLCVLGPHVLPGRVSELYAHPVVALVVLFAFRGEPGRFPTWRRRAFVAYLVVAVVASTHKWIEMRRTGVLAATATTEIAESWPARPPASVCSGPSADSGFAYSVFRMGPYAATYGGVSTRGVWGWERPIAFTFASTLDACCATGADAVIRWTDRTADAVPRSGLCGGS